MRYVSGTLLQRIYTHLDGAEFKLLLVNDRDPLLDVGEPVGG